MSCSSALSARGKWSVCNTRPVEPAVPMSIARSRREYSAGENVSSREPTELPVTLASPRAAAASTALWCWGRKPGFVAIRPDLDHPERPACHERESQRGPEDLAASLPSRAVKHDPSSVAMRRWR